MVFYSLKPRARKEYNTNQRQLFYFREEEDISIARPEEFDHLLQRYIYCVFEDSTKDGRSQFDKVLCASQFYILETKDE